MLMFEKVTTESDVEQLSQLAEHIWREHFGQLFDISTLSKIIQSSQSKQAIQKQIAEGYPYFFILVNGNRVGYFSYKIDLENKVMFLSKLYLKPEQRRRGEGQNVLAHLQELCDKSGVDIISLTVYHKNDLAVNAYLKWGFIKKGIIQRDFGDGLIFDDYKMEKKLQ